MLREGYYPLEFCLRVDKEIGCRSNPFPCLKPPDDFNQPTPSKPKGNFPWFKISASFINVNHVPFSGINNRFCRDRQFCPKVNLHLHISIHVWFQLSTWVRDGESNLCGPGFFRQGGINEINR